MKRLLNLLLFITIIEVVTNSNIDRRQNIDNINKVLDLISRPDSQIPSIDDFIPKSGPVSGGTQVTITGNYSNAGSPIKAYIGDMPCEILSVNENQVQCRTSLSPEKQTGKLRMEFGQNERECDAGLFQFEDDPTINSTNPKTPKGIPAGGIKVFVHGNNLKIIQKPQMYVYFDDKKFVSHCTTLSNTEMECDSPVIDVDSDKLNADEPAKLEFGFMMNDVGSVQNLSSKGHRKFELYPNPRYIQFEEKVNFFKSEYSLKIHGQNLDRPSRETDIVVLIGESVCNITSLSRQKLECRPTHIFDSNENPKVLVKVGKSLSFDIGVVSFASPTFVGDLSANRFFASY